MPEILDKTSDQIVLGPEMQKPTELLDTVFELYGFLPKDDDSRWPFLVQYHQVQNELPFKPINFANAQGATYLSEVPSFATGFVTTPVPENQRQLRRALDNLAFRQEIGARFEASSSSEFEGYDIRLALTDSLVTDPTKPLPEITPCPEALYQVRLFDCGDYVARVGFNIHSEDGTFILSIVNIQGTPKAQERNQEFIKAHGTSPFNLLVKRVLNLAESQWPAYTVRGLVNPARGNSRLYWGVLSAEGVDMYRAHRKPAIHEVSEVALQASL